MGATSFFHQFYYKSTGYSFTNLGRLFLRMFVGLMLSQYGIRQLAMGQSELLGGIPYLESGLAEWLVIVVEVVCSFFIMIGFFTRLMIIPPFILMIASCHKLVVDFGFLGAECLQWLALPFMFMGIFFFILLVGPGKISIDYFFSLYLINRHKSGKEEDLEEV